MSKSGGDCAFTNTGRELLEGHSKCGERHSGLYISLHDMRVFADVGGRLELLRFFSPVVILVPSSCGRR